jgi:hypothetical protein
MIRTTHTIIVEREITVEVDYTPPSRGGYFNPPEPADVEIVGEHDLTEDEIEQVRQEVIDNPPERYID